MKKASAFASAIGRNDIVFDLGAHVGYFTMIAARAGATVVAVEPSDANTQDLRQHLEWNAMSERVSVVKAAVGARVGTSGFVSDGYMGGLSPSASETVDVVTVDDLALRFGVPTVVKIDVEGAEADVLAGASQVLSAGPTIFLATHGDAQAAECRSRLFAFGYSVSEYCDDPRELRATLVRHAR
jgi:FkbM family methyltransferase